MAGEEGQDPSEKKNIHKMKCEKAEAIEIIKLTT